MKTYLYTSLFLFGLLTCSKNAKRPPKEFFGEWEWAYTLVLKSNTYGQFVYDTIYPHDSLWNVNFDAQMMIDQKGNIELYNSGNLHFKMSHKKMDYRYSPKINYESSKKVYETENMYNFLSLNGDKNSNLVSSYQFPLTFAKFPNSNYDLYYTNECAILNIDDKEDLNNVWTQYLNIFIKK